MTALHLRVLAALTLLTACSDPSPVLDAGPPDAGPSVDRGDAGAADAGAADAGASAADAGGGCIAELTRLADGIPGAHGLAREPEGRLLVADSFGRAGVIDVYGAEPGVALAPLGVGGLRPAGLLVEGERLLVCDPSARTVVAYDRRTLAQDAVLARVDAWNVAADGADGYFVLTFSGNLLRVSSGGSVEVVVDRLQNPFDLAVDPRGCVWVSEQGPDGDTGGAVRCWTFDGSVMDAVDYDWVNPEGLAVAGDGALFVAETARGELLRASRGEVAVVRALDLPVVLSNDPARGELLLGTVGPDAAIYRITSCAP